MAKTLTYCSATKLAYRCGSRTRAETQEQSGEAALSHNALSVPLHLTAFRGALSNQRHPKGVLKLLSQVPSIQFISICLALFTEDCYKEMLYRVIYGKKKGEMPALNPQKTHQVKKSKVWRDGNRRFILTTEEE